MLNEAGNCVLPVGLVFSFWKIGNINQSYPIDFYVAFDLERVITEGSITINKVDDDGNLIDIPAAFKLYKMDGDRKLYYTGSEWSEDEAQGAEFVTSEGTVTIPSLELGVYYIQEVRAPEGYELVTEPYQVNLDGEAVTVNFSNKIQYTIIINYYEKDTTTKLADTYTSEPYTKGDAYNVTDLVRKEIDGYNWDSCDQSVYEGVMSGNLIFNVYYTRVTDPGDGGDPDGGNPGGGNNGGGSSGSGPRNPYNPGGGPGVATEIDPGEVPLADLPNEIPTEIPQEEVPLAGLPKTGQSRNAGTWMAMIAGLVTAVYALIGGKKKEAE
ncbi:MAG TPA: doubled motif LPXTG anchor domain-containing protein [Candidatus Lachnoclostridium stercorigallinarum]|uniref:Doubled motif LPXTG anchor domain-containing protein n=1 Tax=Candidatus Lachnoclostridium stercorigallinarum TaxID=2838634 RepID=A0A9D2K5H8_9FIRM|nr:doubled motif LPXTG anchor domain-containing protein [Candidatus Lachnoclostridium stercorigallinarum]